MNLTFFLLSPTVHSKVYCALFQAEKKGTITWVQGIYSLVSDKVQSRTVLFPSLRMNVDFWDFRPLILSGSPAL